MAEVVDSIIAELIARDNGYIKTFNEATAAHERFTKSVPKIGGAMGIASADAQKYADRHKKAIGDITKAEEDATAKVTRSRKARTASSVAADEKEVASAKKAAKTKADAAIAEAAREAAATKRYRDLAERASASRAIPQSTSGRIGATVRNEASGQRSIPAPVMAGAPEVATAAEVNHLLADRFDLAAKAKVAEGSVKRELADQVDYLRRIEVYKKAGLTETEAQVRAEREIASIERLRSVNAQKQAAKGAGRSGEQFARGAGFNAALGGGAAIAGIAVAAGVSLGIEAIQAATDYARALSEVSKQAGITAEALQVYQHAAAEGNVSQEQFNTGLRFFSDVLGKARTGSVEQAKIFAALGINIKNAASAGDLLPTLIARISSIPDQAKRARVEMALFGESGAKLDGLLSGGNDKVNALADALQRTGSILSSSDIAKLDEVSKKLAEAKAQLMVDISQVVASNAQAIMGLVRAFQAIISTVPEAIRWLQKMNAYQQIGRGVNVEENVRYLQEQRVQDVQRNVQAAFPGLGAKLLGAAPQAGAVNTKLLDNLGTPKGPKGPKGKTQEQIEADFQAELERQQARQLSATASLTETAEDRAKAALQALDAEHASFEKRLANDKGMSDAQKTVLRNAEAAAQASARAKIDDERLDQIADEAFRLADAELAAKEDTLTAQIALARTAKERLDLELQLLAVQKQREVARLDNQIDTGNLQQATEASDALKRVDPTFAGRERQTRQQNKGPLGEYLDSLPKTAAEVDEALERVAVGSLQRINDGMADWLTKLTGIKGEAGEVLNALIKIGLQMLQVAAFGDGSGGGSGLGGIASTIGSIFGGGSPLGSFSFAGGGSMTIGGKTGTDKNVLSLNGRKVANVGHGEVLSVSPNAAASNQRAATSVRMGDVKNYNVTVNAENSVSPAGFAAGLARQILAEADRMDNQRQGQTLQAVPGRVGRANTLGS